jgi:hypothetical protein
VGGGGAGGGAGGEGVGGGEEGVTAVHCNVRDTSRCRSGSGGEVI